MSFIVDRIEDNIVVLENEQTKEITEVNISKLPLGIHEGAILEYNNNIYTLNKEKEQKKREEILLKFKNLRK